MECYDVITTYLHRAINMTIPSMFHETSNKFILGGPASGAHADSNQSRSFKRLILLIKVVIWESSRGVNSSLHDP
jgi:hypothetical protein